MSYLTSLLEDTKTKLQSDHVDIKEVTRGILSLSPIGENPQQAVILSCGIHGNETAPIEMMDDLLSNLISGELTLGCNLFIIFGHIEAMKKQVRFIDFNLNRLFSGQWENYQKCQEAKRARDIEGLVQDFLQDELKAIHLDLHTAIARSHHPKFCICPQILPFADEELEQLSSLGLEALILNSQESSTFSYYTQKLIGKRGFSATVELGKVMPFGQNNRSDFSTAYLSLEHLIKHGELPRAPQALTYEVKRALIKDHENYELILEKPYYNFTLLDPQKPIEKTLKGLNHPDDNEYIIFPNQDVVVGQRSGLILARKN